MQVRAMCGLQLRDPHCKSKNIGIPTLGLFLASIFVR